MTAVFLRIVNMSISAGFIVLAVLMLRLLLKKAPKWITVLLWGVVALRLICPVTVESVMSLMPSAEAISPEIMIDASPEINTGITFVDNTINPIIGNSLSPNAGASINPLQILMPVLATAWIVGIVILLAYTVFSYWRLKRKIGTAVLLRDNIYQSENVVSPFVLGIIKPKIYLPFNINEQDAENVIAHEKAHISRKDHLWKPLGFILLTLHWFNPLMWIGYILLCRDIELACDEKVVENFDNEQKVDYSQALLACSVNRRVIAACPLAFGEVGVKKRVKSVLNYKKPAFWIIVVSIVLCAVVAVCFLTNPKNQNDQKKIVLDPNFYTEYDGVYLTIDSVGTESDGNKIFNVVWHNDTDKVVYYGESYSIEYKNGDEWKIVDTGEFYFNEIAYLLKPNSVAKMTYGTSIADVSKKGLYRLLLRFSVEGEGGYCMWLQFEVKEDKKETGNSENSIEHLKAKFPHYFDLPRGKGLEVYIWQLAEGHYSCGLGLHTNMVTPKEWIWNLHTSPATIEEMRAIVASYNIPKNQVVITPVVMPHSSYHYEINQEYREKVTELFWAE